jgi:hypothetical protein
VTIFGDTIFGDSIPIGIHIAIFGDSIPIGIHIDGDSTLDTLLAITCIHHEVLPLG